MLQKYSGTSLLEISAQGLIDGTRSITSKKKARVSPKRHPCMRKKCSQNIVALSGNSSSCSITAVMEFF